MWNCSPQSFIPLLQTAIISIYFTGVRGARIHAKYLRPKEAGGPHPAILQFHGYSGNAGDWSDKLAFTSLGISSAGSMMRRRICWSAISFWIRFNWPSDMRACRRSMIRSISFLIKPGFDQVILAD
ncbi:acetylxylan esterase [Paenibacillus borealis]|uniref:acetylxylan esterase n=1 Tax=Paenibacillus borealis TaxID=160799 RepID=UPI000693742D